MKLSLEVIAQELEMKPRTVARYFKAADLEPDAAGFYDVREAFAVISAGIRRDTAKLLEAEGRCITMEEARRRTRRFICYMRKHTLQAEMPEGLRADLLAMLDAKTLNERFKADSIAYWKEILGEDDP